MTREEAITVLNMVEAHGPLVIKAKEMAIEALKQTEQKKGKWLFNLDPRWGDFICSECWERNIICTNYCPNCGAEME